MPSGPIVLDFNFRLEIVLNTSSPVRTIEFQFIAEFEFKLSKFKEQ